MSEAERAARIARIRSALQIKAYKDAEKALLDEKERVKFEQEERKREFMASLCHDTKKGMEKGGMDWVEAELEDRGLDTVEGSKFDIIKRLDNALRAEAAERRANLDRLMAEQRAKDAAEEAARLKKEKEARKQKMLEEERRRQRLKH